MDTVIEGGLVFDAEHGSYAKQDLVIREGRIASLLPEGEGPSSLDGKAVRIVDARDRFVLPGLIDAHSHMGMWVSRPLGNDCNECSNPMTPGVRAIDGINPRDPDFQKALQAGFTTMMLTPGSGNLIGGQAATLRLCGKTVRDMTWQPYSALKAALGENPISVYGPVGKSPASRMANAALLEETLACAWEYSKISEADQNDAYWDIFLPLFQKLVPLKIHAHRADDILTAIRIVEKFPIRYTLDHCTEGYLIVDELAARNVPLLVGPLFMFKTKDELKNKSEYNPVSLVERGCSVSLISDHPFAGTMFLPAQAGLLVKAGLPEQEALKLLTINPARALGLDHEIGSLTPGKRADVVLYQGNPLEIRSCCTMTMMDGVVIYNAEEERIRCC